MVSNGEIFPREVSGDVSPIDLYSAIGKALTAWELTEIAHGHLFAAVISAKQPDAIWAAYGAIDSSANRTAMILAAAKWSLQPNNPDLEKRIKDKLNYTNKLAMRRNEIAHGTVMGFTHGSGFIKPGQPMSIFYLIPPSYSSKRHIRNRLSENIATIDVPYEWYKYCYVAKQVDMYRELFNHHGDDIWNLAIEVAKIYNDT